MELPQTVRTCALVAGSSWLVAGACAVVHAATSLHIAAAAWRLGKQWVRCNRGWCFPSVAAVLVRPLRQMALPVRIWDRRGLVGFVMLY